MPRVTYSAEAKAEAIALAAIVGARTAGERLGIDHRTVRTWATQAGASVADTIDAPSWERLGALALAKAERMLAGGKVSAIQAATMAAIAKRNAGRPRVDAESSARDAQDAFGDWLYDTLAAGPVPDVVDLDAYMDKLEAAVGAIVPELLLPAANAEDANRRDVDGNGPHRTAILAWFSGRDDQPAGDVLEWAQAQVLGAIAEYGDLVAWHASILARQHRDDVIRQRARVLADSGMQPHEAAVLAAEISGDLA